MGNGCHQAGKITFSGLSGVLGGGYGGVLMFSMYVFMVAKIFFTEYVH